MSRYTLGKPTDSGAPVMLQHRMFGKPVRWVRTSHHWVNEKGRRKYVGGWSSQWPAIEFAWYAPRG